jgi:hypothetical protein
MSGEFSREALEGRLGPVLFAYAEEQGRSAPDPTPELVERLRRIFAPTVARLAAERATARREPAAARTAA